MLLHLLVRLLDSETREVWELKINSSTEYPSLDQFQKFLTSRTRAFETLNANPSTSYGVNRTSRFLLVHESRARSFVAAALEKAGGNTCRLCKLPHYLSSCPKFLAYDVQRRIQEVNKLKVCYNCLGLHLSHQCNSSRRCRKCGKKHHTILHKIISPFKPKAESSTDENSRDNSTMSYPPQITSK